MDCLLLLLLILFTEYHPFNLDTCMTSFLCPTAHTNQYMYSFFPHTIHLWNNLPDSVVHSNSLNTFKHSLQLYHMYLGFRMYASINCTLFHASFNFVEKKKELSPFPSLTAPNTLPITDQYQSSQ